MIDNLSDSDRPLTVKLAGNSGYAVITEQILLVMQEWLCVRWENGFTVRLGHYPASYRV
jgi:hypothetical protein